MMVFQTTSDKLIDLMINHPEVRGTIDQGSHKLSSLELLSDHRNVCIACEGGAAIFEYEAPGVYKGHILLLPEYRGATGLAFGRAAIARLRALVGSLRLVAGVPLALPAARWYVRRLEFVSTGRHSGQEWFEMEIS